MRSVEEIKKELNEGSRDFTITLERFDELLDELHAHPDYKPKKTIASKRIDVEYTKESNSMHW